MKRTTRSRSKRAAGSVRLPKGKRFWLLDYFVRGRRVRESSRTEDEEEALELLAKKIAASRRPSVLHASRVRIEALLDLLVAEYKSHGRRTLYDTQLRVDGHLRPFFGSMRALELTAGDVRAYCVSRRAKGASPATCNREVSLLRRAFNLAVKDGLIDSAPPFPQRLPESAPRQGFFEREDFDRVLARLPEHLRPVAEFAWWTGWRKREVLELPWSEVDLHTGVVRLSPARSKTGRGRELVLTPVLIAILERQASLRATFAPDFPLVFWWGTSAGPRAIKDPRMAWKRACKEAGVPERLFHDLRRTAARNLVRAGIPERVAMDITGHKTRSIFDRYNITSEADRRAAAEAMHRAYGGPSVTESATVTETVTPTTGDRVTKPLQH